MIQRIIIFILLGVALMACGGSAGNGVQSAVEHFDQGNYAGSRSIVDRLVADSAALDTMSVGSLCELAVLCLRLDSISDPVSDTSGQVFAARCLSRARSIDADSVERFMRTLPRETAQSLTVIDRVATYLAIPRDSLVVEGDTVQ